MVRPEGWNGCDVAVEVARQALKEYEDEDVPDEERSLTRYVEVVTGAKFGIRVKLDASFKWFKQTVAFEIYIDGVCVHSRIYGHSTLFGGLSTGHEYSTNGKVYVQEFMFSDLKIDDTTAQLDANRLKKLANLGTIQVKIHRVNLVSEASMRSNKLSGGIDKFSEKALKGRAISHTIKLAEPKLAVKTTTYDIHYIDPKGKPAVQIVFKYRSKSALQTLRVIPRSPTPVPLEDRPIDTLTLEELRELARRNQERRSSQPLAGTKREFKDEPLIDDSDDEGPTVVESRPVKSAKIATIDLTGVD